MQIWYQGISTTSSPRESERPEANIPEFTLAVNRRVHYNFYHNIQELYSVFLMMEFFEIPQAKTNILFVEKNQSSLLNKIWTEFFNWTTDINSLAKKVRFDNLVLSLSNHDNPMNLFNAQTLPLSEEFRNFVLSTYQIPADYPLNCKAIHIVFLWRKHTVSYSQNPKTLKKSLTRKIYNTEEILKFLRARRPEFNVTTIQIEQLSFKEQLGLVSETDILIGMLGAGLTHALFLPPHAGVIELRPSYWTQTDLYFQAIAKWRGLHYQRWKNRNKFLEGPRYQTYIPPNVILTQVGNVYKRICGTVVQEKL